MLSYRKKTQSLPPPPIFLGKEKISRRGGERYPTTKVHANADETLSARIRAQQRSNRTRLDIFIVFPPFLRLHARLRATHFISLRFPPRRKRKPKERVIPSARKKKGKRAFEIPRRTGCATLFAGVFLLTDATETHLFVIWAIADIIIVCVCVWWYALSVRACGM